MKHSRNLRWMCVLAVSVVLLAGCGRKAKQASTAPGTSAEPDKVLYENAMRDIENGKHLIGRLTLQTLINSYPDSEYLAKAKLAIADSYYNEGGTSGLTQAVAEYRDFRTFFEHLDEAAYAQMQIGRAYYRRMEKPDRDRTQARLAEQELQTFLLKYPDHKLTPEAKQRLREVQEVLAEGDFRVGRFYFLKDTPNARRAAIMRLADIVDRYPLYSQADRALWMLGESLLSLEQTKLAEMYLTRLVKEYPLSQFVDPAKERLTKLGVPIPQPNPEALARQQEEMKFGDPMKRKGLTDRALGMLKSGPSVQTAARTGEPNLEPPREGYSESLTRGLGLQVSGTATGAGTTGGSAPLSGSQTEPVATATPGGNSSANPPAATKPAESSSAADKNKQKPGDKDKKEDPKKESSSKKKKGLRKLIPW